MPRRPLAPSSLPALPLRAAPLWVLLALLASPVPAGAESQAPDEQSVERCAAEKLEAAGRMCDGLLSALGRPGNRGKGVGALQRETRRLERRFAKTESVPLEWGGSCAVSTAGSEAVADLLAAETEAVADAFPADGFFGRIRRQQQLRALGWLCESWLDAEAEHLENRFYDRLQTWLAKDRDLAERIFAWFYRLFTWIFGPGGAPDADAAAERIAALVDEVVATVAVSPEVSPEWEMVEPGVVADYRGRSLEPTCWDGDPWVFFVKRGTVNKLVMYYQGGGACWSAVTCGGIPPLGVSPTFKRSAGPGDNPANFSSGFADGENPDNPFRDWHQVFVPYCTGDVHWGDSVVDYELLGNTTTVRHKGFVNAQVAERFALQHFVHPEQVFVTGSSAGAYGAIVNSLFLQERVYPSADFAVLGDAGNGVITQDFLVNDLSNWGIQDNLPPWMPGLNVPLESLRASDLYIEGSATYPQNRFATYTTAYDGGSGGQTGFFHVMRLGESRVAEWPLWWRSSCEWNEEMLVLNEEAATAAPENFRFYVGTGSAHTMWGRNKVYDDTTGNVPTVRDWLVSMLADDAGWTNVLAEDFGVLLPGDPRPSPSSTPPLEPFDLDAERIVCD